MKKNNIIKSLLLIAMTSLPVATMQAETIEINSFDDYATFVNTVNNGTDIYIDAKLNCDIDAEGRFISNAYHGTFDGQGHTITGIGNNSYWTYGGLVGELYGTIKNLTVKDISLNGDNDYVGGIAGCMYGDAKIENCTVYGSLSASYVGGIVGWLGGTGNATITNCTFYGELRAFGIGGGIVGYISHNNPTITNCNSYGKIASTNDYEFKSGLLIGMTYNSTPTMSGNFYNTATATLTNKGQMVAPRAIGCIGDNVNIADVPGQYEGKLLGYAIKLIDNSTWTELTEYYVDKEYSMNGETVTITAKPYEGEGIKCCVREGNPRIFIAYDPSVAQSRAAAPGMEQYITATSIGNDQYTFTMPEGNVIVETISDIMYDLELSKQWTTFYYYNNSIYWGYDPQRYYKVTDGFNAYTVTDVNLETGVITLSEPLEYVLFNTPLLIERTGDTQQFWLQQAFPVEEPVMQCSEYYIGNSVSRQFNNAEAFFLNDGVFRLCEKSILPAGRCYIGQPYTPMPIDLSRELRIVKNGESTGISEKGIVKSEKYATASGTYTLGGQQVKAPVKAGIYINNGKKVVIK